MGCIRLWAGTTATNLLHSTTHSYPEAFILISKVLQQESLSHFSGLIGSILVNDFLFFFPRLLLSYFINKAINKYHRLLNDIAAELICDNSILLAPVNYMDIVCLLLPFLPVFLCSCSWQKTDLFLQVKCLIFACHLKVIFTEQQYCQVEVWLYSLKNKTKNPSKQKKWQSLFKFQQKTSQKNT